MTLTFTTLSDDTTRMGSRDKKDLYKTRLPVCLLIGTNSDLHDVLHSNRQTGLSSGAKFLHMERTVFEKGVAVVVLELYLSDKALMEVYNGGKLALFNTNETTILFKFVNW